MALIFIKIGLKLSYFAKKSFFSSAGGSDPHTLCLQWLGVLPQTLIASNGWGICPQNPATPPPIADFWLRACMNKNLLHVTAGLHLY